MQVPSTLRSQDPIALVNTRCSRGSWPLVKAKLAVGAIVVTGLTLSFVAAKRVPATMAARGQTQPQTLHPGCISQFVRFGCSCCRCLARDGDQSLAYDDLLRRGSPRRTTSHRLQHLITRIHLLCSRYQSPLSSPISFSSRFYFYHQ